MQSNWGLWGLVALACGSQPQLGPPLRPSSHRSAVAGPTLAAPTAASESGPATSELQVPARLHRTPAVDAELARDAAELGRLRAVPPGNRLRCEQFRRLQLAEGLAQRRAAGEPRMNECSDDAARVVACLETPDGLFVPVEQPAEMCRYRLWFVPREPTARLVPLSEAFEEFDLAFTVRWAAEDLDDDGVIEALLIRGWSHPEGVGEGQEAHLIEPNGDERRLPFDDLRDVDGDGRVDALFGFGDRANAAGCEPRGTREAWVPRYLASPQLLLHRVQGFRFSLTDELARQGRAKACQSLGASVVARRAGAVDEDETLRRAVCRLADGADPVAIGRELAAACTRDFEMPTDCQTPRPGVCFWRRTLLALPDVFATLRPWLDGPGAASQR